jgi:GTP pyrophosphokinase
MIKNTVTIKLGFLKAAEDRESFFKRIALIFPRSDYRYKLIEKAYNYAKDAFRGTPREDGERYFEHVRAVTLIVIDYLRITDYKIIIAALLHDNVEDIPSWTIKRIAEEFGEEVACLVDYLTKPKKEYPTKEQQERAYHFRFHSAPREFFLIKLADRLHNVLTLGGCSLEKRRRKVEETYLHYMPYAQKHFILLHELEWALKQVKI